MIMALMMIHCYFESSYISHNFCILIFYFSSRSIYMLSLPCCRVFLGRMVSSTGLIREQVPSFVSRKRRKVSDFQCQDQDSHVSIGNYVDTSSSAQSTEEGCSSQWYYMNSVLRLFSFVPFIIIVFIILTKVLQVCGSH